MSLHPAMQAMIDAREAAGIPTFRALGLEGARQMSAASAQILGQGLDMARIEDLAMSAAGAKLPLRLYVPQGDLAGLLVFYHGGGWVLGSIEGYDPVCRRLAQSSGCAILSVDYRLAPEHRFPTAAEDGYAALCWAAENVRELTGRDLPLAVGGDSAGGNIAAVAALLSRDRGGPAVAVQCLVFPVTDCDFSRHSYHAFAEGGLLTAEAMHWFWDQYVPEAADRYDPLVSPLRAPSLAGLPPALVELAGHDPLLDEGRAFAERLAASGVEVDVRCHDGLCHGYFQLESLLPPARDAVESLGARLRDRLRA